MLNKQVSGGDFLLEADLHQFRRHYGVQIRIVRNDEKPLKVHYGVYASTVNLFRPKEAQASLRIDRQQVYINDAMPDLQLDKLADRLMKTFYPVEIALSKKNRLSMLVNRDEIIQRYHAAVPDLERYFNSSFGHRCIRNFGDGLYNDATIRHAVHADWFVCLVFGGVAYGNYRQGRKRNCRLMLPVIPYGPAVEFTGDVVLEQSPHHPGILRATVDAPCTDLRSWRDAWKGKPKSVASEKPLSGRAMLTFLLKKHDRTLMVAEGNVQLEHEGQRYSVTVGIYDQDRAPLRKPSTNTRPELLEVSTHKTLLQRIFKL